MRRLANAGRLAQAGAFYGLLLMLPFSIATIEIAFVVLLAGWLFERLNPATRWDTVWLGRPLRPVVWGLGIFFVAAALSIPGSASPKLSLHGLICKWAEYLFYLVVTAEIASRPGIVKRSMAVLAASAVFVVVEGLTQEVWGRGIFRGHQLMVYSRMTGPFTNPIDLAIQFMTVLGVLLAGATVVRGPWRPVLWGIIGLSVACLGRTLALGPWVALLVGFSAVIVPVGGRLRRAGMVLLGLVVAAGGFFLWRMRMTHAVLTLSDVGTSDRVFMWQSALRMIADRPLLGHGLNTFMSKYLEYWVGGERMPRYAHNCYLQMAAETGLIGLAAFVALLWRIGRRIWQAVWSSAGENQVLLAYFLACWRWLMSPPQATAWAPAFPLTRLSLAAVPAARPRRVLLASIHVPWHRSPSHPLG